MLQRFLYRGVVSWAASRWGNCLTNFYAKNKHFLHNLLTEYIFCLEQFTGYHFVGTLQIHWRSWIYQCLICLMIWIRNKFSFLSSFWTKVWIILVVTLCPPFSLLHTDITLLFFRSWLSWSTAVWAGTRSRAPACWATSCPMPLGSSGLTWSPFSKYNHTVYHIPHYTNTVIFISWLIGSYHNWWRHYSDIISWPYPPLIVLRLFI